jgi:hypothetical protein
MPVMTPALRKFALTAHVTFSVGWLGAVVAYLALAIAGLTSQDAQVVRSAYLAMKLTGWFVIVPLSLASLLTGLVQSLGTDWGLFRHYWILVKFVLTVGATTILLLHMPEVSRMKGVVAEVVHGGGGLLVLLATTTLSVYKPWGRTGYGRRKQPERHMRITAHPVARISRIPSRGDASMADLPSDPDSNDDTGEEPDHESTTGSRWGLYVLLGTVGLVLLFVILHLIGGGHGSHGH